MALLMGFTGSLHCAGMCGPIVWVMPFQAFEGWKKALAVGLYHVGRISVYAVLAIALHSFRDLFDPRVQQYISIALGSLLLIAGLVSFIPNRQLKYKLPWGEFVKRQLGHVIGNPTLGAITLSGILNGLLPCGLVYMALSAAVTAATKLQAVSLIYMFGLGTIPMLVGITLLKGKLNFFRTPHIKKLVPMVVFVFGCLFVLRGMNLGIPYLSPEVVVEKQQIKSCCSHKTHN
jgi:sulfite exporter TauE/SafE